ncbi:YncE family protein [Streptacidiphilus sp. MAP5-3]|uniref:YncE family protein n=1 Tax=unclassified Streptacidiphilus TaxID=2643834 RepID=UPI003516CA11
MRKRSLCTVTACAVLLGVTTAGPAAAAGSAASVEHTSGAGLTAHITAPPSGTAHVAVPVPVTAHTAAASAPAAAHTATRASAQTAASAPVTVSAFGGMAVDGPLDRVFVGDSTAGSVTAADYSGDSLATVSGIAGVSDLAVSTDGTTLYAAEPTTHDVVVLNASTLAVEATYPVATTKGPTHLAFTSGKLWFTYGDQWSGNLGSVDPSVNTSGGAGAVTLGQMPAGVGAGLWNPALTSTQPSAPGALALAETGLSTDSMAVLDVSSGTPQLTAWYQGDYSLNSGINDISLVPGASQVLVNGTLLDGYANGKFSKVGSYPNNASVGTASPDGYVAQSSGATVYVFKAGSQTPLHTYPSNASALAWAPDDSRVFALAGQNTATGTAYGLQVLTDPTKVLPTLTASAPASGTVGKAYTVSGKVSSQLPIPADTQLSVTRVDLAHPAGYLTAFKPVTAADGSWHFTDTSSIGGPVTYRIGYAGDSEQSAVSASATINIARSATTVSISANSSGYSYGGWAHVTAHLGRTWNGRTVEIDALPVGMPQTLVARGTVDRYGNLSAWYKVTRNTRFSAWFAGDYFYGTAWAGRWVNGYAEIADVLDNAYGSNSYAGYRFQLFHQAKPPVMGIAVGPNKADQCITLTGQWYYSGGWHILTPQGCFTLGSNGVVWIQLNLTGFPLGSHFRIAPEYGGDGINAATWGNWLYFSITS